MPSRRIGDLTFREVTRRVGASSILCLPLGSLEQHGPHLPLDTDAVLAQALTDAIVARWRETYDLWQLPMLPLGLSREHAWAAGTMSLTVAAMSAVLHDLGREIARALPARNLMIVNGHGGNRGILDAVMHELRADFGLNVCALHLGALISPVTGAALPEIHGGKDETSVMLALAPDRVRRDRIADLKSPPDGDAIRALVLDPGVSFPWSSGDKRIADTGIMGDAAAASAEHGQALVARVVEAAGGVLKQLLENSRVSDATLYPVRSRESGNPG
jgi:creatinine amidohydrolase/Fe(II)-dependent formamide hydrolase-like protein